MKKLLLSAAIAAFAFTSVNAQDSQTPDIKSKKGETYLPEAGDWAIQIDGSPYLTSVFNVFNSTGSNSVTPDYLDGFTGAFAGKYFKDANTAYRVKLNLAFGSNTTTTPVMPSGEDKVKNSSNSIILGAGLEKRRGSTRLQGFYGAEALVSLGGSKTTNEYAVITAGDVVETKVGSTLGFGVRGFIGAEYFILPKFSLGVEYGWGLGFKATGAGETTVYNGTANVTTETGKSSSFGAMTDISGGAINLTLHF